MTDAMIFGHDFAIRETKMPTSVHGCLVMDDEGRANIYVNESDPEDRKREAVNHEVIHYTQDDLYEPDEMKAERSVRMKMPKMAVYALD